MKYYYPVFSGVLALLWVSAALARPVSYPDGWTVMQMNDADVNSLHVHYSPTINYSLGYKGEYHRADEWQFHGAQLNYLAKRWNAPQTQANLYLKSGAGIAYSDFGRFNSETEAAAFAGIAADWESRKYFTSYENRYLYAGDIDRSFTQKARVGFAPYVGNYGDLHTWLMLQVEHQPTAEHHVTVTPLVRFFKGDTLFEAGMNNHGKLLINTIIRY